MGALWCAAVAAMSMLGEISDADGAVQDARIESAIETAFLFNEVLAAFPIDVTVRDGVVTLSGQVPGEIQRDLAGEIAFSLDGVREVRNELTVDGAISPAPPDRVWKRFIEDKSLAASLRARLLYRKELQGLRVGVRVDGAKATLTGVVTSQEQKRRIGDIALETRGIDDVVNELTVVPREDRSGVDRFAGTISDEWTEKRVEANILWHRDLSIRKLDIEVNDGLCVLTGFAQTEETRALAGEVAESVQGVTGVRNEILLPGEEPPEPPPIKDLDALEPEESVLLVLPEPEPEMAVPGEAPAIESVPIRP